MRELRVGRSDGEPDEQSLTSLSGGRCITQFPSKQYFHYHHSHLPSTKTFVQVSPYSSILIIAALCRSTGSSTNYKSRW